MKIKRKPRNTMSKKFDTLKPITIDQIGTSEDPCFGKYYSISAAECQRCGDSEICAIVKAQKNHLKRIEVESEKNFKDLEKPPVKTKKEVRPFIRARVRELVNGAGKKGILFDEVFDDVKGSYSKFGFSMDGLRLIINKVIEKKNYKQKENKIYAAKNSTNK